MWSRTVSYFRFSECDRRTDIYHAYIAHTLYIYRFYCKTLLQMRWYTLAQCVHREKRRFVFYTERRLHAPCRCAVLNSQDTSAALFDITACELYFSLHATLFEIAPISHTYACAQYVLCGYSACFVHSLRTVPRPRVRTAHTCCADSMTHLRTRNVLWWQYAKYFDTAAHQFNQ